MLCQLSYSPKQYEKHLCFSTMIIPNSEKITREIKSERRAFSLANVGRMGSRVVTVLLPPPNPVIRPVGNRPLVNHLTAKVGAWPAQTNTQDVGSNIKDVTNNSLCITSIA